ncbi:MAG TPA: tyrosine-type recombinase/integrase, partial [Xanthobacteraceae bacterium]|nr:tyrosine-type recombinase/integrase [Xanthobacteraceae bacterium]
HIRDGRVKFRQAKNEHRNPVDVDMPLHHDLAASIEATAPHQHLAFLISERNRPFTPASFGNWFRDKCYSANLPGLSAHGVRKMTAADLAEEGASPHEIGAITGHKTLSQIENYTRSAQRRRLADQAMRKLKKRT